MRAVSAERRTNRLDPFGIDRPHSCKRDMQAVGKSDDPALAAVKGATMCALAHTRPTSAGGAVLEVGDHAGFFEEAHDSRLFEVECQRFVFRRFVAQHKRNDTVATCGSALHRAVIARNREPTISESVHGEHHEQAVSQSCRPFGR